MRKVNLSIIILSYNTRSPLKQCLDSVGRGCKGVEGCEVIVVDNGSADGSVEEVRKFIKSVKSERTEILLIENKENLGFAKGNNEGVKVAIGKYLFFLNSDTIVKNGAVCKLVDYLESHSEVAAVSPLLLNEDGSIQKDPCYLKFPTPIFVFFYYFKPFQKIVNRFFPKLIYSTLNFESPSLVDQLPGAALMIRKQIFEKIGGFGENFPHFFEDVDLSYNLRRHGYKLFLVPQSKITHFGGKSLEPKIKKEGIESYYLLSFHGLFRFCEKNYSSLNCFLIKGIIFANLALKLRFDLIKKLYLK